MSLPNEQYIMTKQSTETRKPLACSTEVRGPNQEGTNRVLLRLLQSHAGHVLLPCLLIYSVVSRGTRSELRGHAKRSLSLGRAENILQIEWMPVMGTKYPMWQSQGPEVMRIVACECFQGGATARH